MHFLLMHWAPIFLLMPGLLAPKLEQTITLKKFHFDSRAVQTFSAQSINANQQVILNSLAPTSAGAAPTLTLCRSSLTP